ncbi:methylated-DNA--[protein]-cysteine S-methyltransferase [Helicobacter sp. MIT 01-3238]|uniref:methylated-DNA--[protein]-cysteine S-methyltransferase n=1 Tax=Helicobacter sp. MIT 01-3238 TaxID=398627 RepID=UPI002161C4C2|nr:methylated-DNA--[protein]-cysteine S-methyltransferase [Helicobacter sp. MIT 01-3238]
MGLDKFFVSFYTPPADFSSLGKITLLSPKNFDDFDKSFVLLGESRTKQYLSGIYFENNLAKPQSKKSNNQNCDTKGEIEHGLQCDSWIFNLTKKWLDMYFGGEIPHFLPPLALQGSSFALLVWQELLKIRYGSTTTYATMATKIAQQRGLAKMSAQAIGGALKNNPISIIIPCHRVIGTNGSLIGYAGGIEKKKILLGLENLTTT